MTFDTISGFSLTNRMLLYASIMLAPAQGSSGWKSNCPSNIGFLAYNLYTQISWFRAAKAQRFHALSLLVPHFNLVYAFSYLPGVISGNVVMGAAQGFITAGLILLNTVVGWTSWKTNLPEGFGEYKFFFFGWRTLTHGWYKFLLVWEIADTLFAVSLAFTAIFSGIMLPIMFKDDDDDDGDSWLRPWLRTWILISAGAAIMCVFFWPLALWVELIISRNHIESATDWVAVWLFVVQAVMMVIPTFGFCSSGGCSGDDD